MAKIYEHITFEERKVINNLLSTTRESAKTIGELIHKDPTSISKELKRNRYISIEAITVYIGNTDMKLQEHKNVLIISW